MKLFPTLIVLVLCSYLVYNVEATFGRGWWWRPHHRPGHAQQNYAQQTGKWVKNLSQKMASLTVTVRGIQKRVNKATEFATEVGTLRTEVGTLKKQLADKKCVSGRAVFNHVHQNRIGHFIRRQSQHVKFASPFAAVPAVTAGFVYIDAKKKVNLRVRTYVSNVGRSGFHLRVEEWGNSYTYALHVAWMACSK